MRRTFGDGLVLSAAAAVVALLAALVVWRGRSLLVIEAGALAALALRGSSRWVAARTRLPYAAALTGIVVLTLTATGFGLYFLGAGIYQQANALAEQLPAAWHSTMEALGKQPFFAGLVPSSGLPPGPHVNSDRLLSGAGGVLEVLSAAVVIFFIGLYGAASPGGYARVVLLLVPPSRRGRADAVLDDLATSLTHWLGSRAIAMVSVGAIVTLGLYVMKIPLAGILGVLAGWLTFVEYLGAVASAAPALLLAISRGTPYVAAVAVLFTIAHLIEGYVLTPLLIRATVRIPPAYTLSAQVVMGSVFGVLGLTLATPVTIVLTVLVRDLYVNADDTGTSQPRMQSEPRDEHVG
ncbi:MAG: AI-2E family transporter [Polyangiaceae bacterium]